MKILFCTDGSQISFNALKNISCWVREAVIDVICVADLTFLPSEITVAEFSASCPDIAQSILNYAQEEINRLNLTCNEKIRYCGNAVESILEQAQKKDYDLILMGSHGKKGLQKWLGSVSGEIIHSSKISDYISKVQNNCERMLVTTDGTNCSSGIIKEILPSINLENKEIYICMVNEEPDFLFLDGMVDTNWLLDIERRQQIFASKAVDEIKEIFACYNANIVETSIMSGIPAQKIKDFANSRKIDLIVMGSRNKSQLDRFLSGSVSKRTIENVQSDVWLARCKN